MAGHSMSSLPDRPGLRPNRACRNCVQIKAKCVPLDDSLTICQRCHRLEKQCTTPAPVSRRRQRERSNDNDLETLPSVTTPSTLPETSTAASQPNPVNAQTRDVNHPITINATDNFRRIQTTAGTVFAISPEIGHAFVNSNHEALFEQYTTQMTKFFPFVVVPPTMSAVTVFQERPFLYTCCVLNAAHRDPSLQARVGRDILRYIGEHVLLGGEKSLDLLQGLLVMVTWYHVYTHNNPQLMNILHLAKALLVDLGFNGAPGLALFRIKMSRDATHIIHGNVGAVPGAEAQNLEARRACLAVYYIHSRYSSSFHRLDPPIWTAYLEESCEMLEQISEYPTDASAVSLVRLCHLIERYTGSEGLRPGAAMPIQTYIKLVVKDIDNYTRALPTSLQSDDVMKLQILDAEIGLLEPIINANTESSIHKIEALHLCLERTSTFFETFIGLAIEDFPPLPFLIWVTVSHALDVTTSLSFTVMEGWDLAYARANPGLVSTVKRMMEKMRQVQQYEDQHHPLSRGMRFKMFAIRMEKFKDWYDAMLQSESDAARQAPSDLDTPDQVLCAVPPVGAVGDYSDLLWQDFMVDWPRLENELGLL